MNSRDIIIANQEHRGAPRPGISFKGTMINDIGCGGTGEPECYEKKSWIEGNIEYYDDIWGNLWQRMVDGCKAGEVIKPVIEDWSQLDDYEVPVFEVDKCAVNYRKGFDSTPGKYKVAGMSGWIFASSRYIRKMEDYLMDMALEPEKVKILHSKVAEVFKIQIEAAGKADADAIMFCEDMGTQSGLLMSPAMWQDYYGELYSELFGMAHDYGMKVWMHSCGKNDEILEPLLKAGVNCLQFDQPTVYDFEWLSTLLDKYTAILWSPIDIQKIMPTGDKTIIRAGVDRMFKYFEGKLIFNEYGDLPGIGVEPEWNRWAYNRIIENIKRK
jgi:uroporphyrinogen decarboxylase